jgi:hypothetical protein
MCATISFLLFRARWTRGWASVWERKLIGAFLDELKLIVLGMPFVGSQVTHNQELNR